LCSLGYLAGLNELGLIPGVRYISGISGGSWATIVFSFKQVDVDDTVFLGPVVYPADITRDGLNQMDAQCARSYTDNDFVKFTLESIKDGSSESIADGWAQATQHFYFEKAGIQAAVPFSLDKDTVQDIVMRNPSLINTEFMLLADKDRPFPMVGTGVVGPAEGAGYAINNRNLTMIEITPLYIGQLRTLSVGYNYHAATDKSHHETVGGAVEPFAFGRTGAAPLLGLQEGQGSGLLRVPVPETVMDLQWAGAASGYAEGAFFESLRPNNLSNTLGLHFVSMNVVTSAAPLWPRDTHRCFIVVTALLCDFMCCMRLSGLLVSCRPPPQGKRHPLLRRRQLRKHHASFHAAARRAQDSAVFQFGHSAKALLRLGRTKRATAQEPGRRRLQLAVRRAAPGLCEVGGAVF
jgi:hypothetical protein